MGWYFIACTYLDPERGRYDYDDYIRMVKPNMEVSIWSGVKELST